MAETYGFHEVKLREGVTGEQLETFWRENRVSFIDDWDGYLLKKRLGSKGDEYLLVYVIEEDRYHHDHPEVNAEIDQWVEQHRDFMDGMARIMAVPRQEHTFIADYDIVGEDG